MALSLLPGLVTRWAYTPPPCPPFTQMTHNNLCIVSIKQDEQF